MRMPIDSAYPVRVVMMSTSTESRCGSPVLPGAPGMATISRHAQTLFCGADALSGNAAVALAFLTPGKLISAV
jgi:hypothetical protein